MKIKTCCGFGHRTILSDIKESLYKAVIEAIENGCKIFYTGAMGDYDSLFSAAVRKAKHTYPYIKLICVKPYFTNDLNTDKEYYTAMYDDVMIPTELVGVHYKAAIKARNRWMVNHCDLVISFIVRDYGGAADAVKYAAKQGKKTINLAE